MTSQELVSTFSFDELGFSVPIARGAAAKAFDECVARGVAARLADDHGGALDAFMEAAEFEQSHRGVQLEIAQSLIDLNRFDDAETIYRDILAIEPNFAAALAGMGHTERRRVNHSQAAEWFAAAAAAEPANLTLQSELAAELRTLARFDESDAVHCGILDRDPKHFGGLIGLAIAFRRRGRRSEALAIFLALLDAHPAHVGLLHEAAHTMTEMADFDQAAAAYRRILEAVPDDPHALIGLGRAAQWRGATAEALEFFRAAVAARLHYTPATLELAGFLRSVSRLDEAHDVLAQALRANPSDSALLLEMAQLPHALHA